MVKGVLIGFGIMIILALIPIVHIAGIPFGPFIGGYYGYRPPGTAPLLQDAKLWPSADGPAPLWDRYL